MVFVCDGVTLLCYVTCLYPTSDRLRQTHIRPTQKKLRIDYNIPKTSIIFGQRIPPQTLESDLRPRSRDTSFLLIICNCQELFKDKYGPIAGNCDRFPFRTKQTYNPKSQLCRRPPNNWKLFTFPSRSRPVRLIITVSNWAELLTRFFFLRPRNCPTLTKQNS